MVGVEDGVEKGDDGQVGSSFGAKMGTCVA